MTPHALRAGWIRAAWPAPAQVHALTTTRAGDAEYGRAFDLGARDRAAALVAASRAALRDATTGPAGRLQWLKQVHGSCWVRASSATCAAVPEADAVWTDEANLGLAIQTADCAPVALADRRGGRIGAAHGGWRGLAGGVLERLVEAMQGEEPLMAWIGPAIGPEAYEVGADVRDALRSAFGASLCAAVCVSGERRGKWRLDLRALAARRLRAAGVGEVHGEPLCTYSDQRLHSHRRDGTTGRMATVIWKTF